MGESRGRDGGESEGGWRRGGGGTGEGRGRDGRGIGERWRGVGGGMVERKAEKVSPGTKKAEKICVCQKKAVPLQTILESEDKFDCLRPL